MAEERLRWGLLSTARINSHLIPGIQRVRRGELVAVASRDQSRADAYAEEWGIPRAYGSYEKLLEDREVDVAYISLPNALHHDWVIESAQAGKHVLCEKPMALSEEQCRAMIQAADGAGVVLSEAYMYRYHPLTERVRELVDEGRLGEVRLVRLALTYSIEREDDVRLSAGLGGGSLWDIGCYGVSISRFIFQDEPQEVVGYQTVGRSGVDEGFVASLRFPGDRIAQFDSGFRAPLRQEAEIVGTEAALLWSYPLKPHVHGGGIILRWDGREEPVPVPEADPFEREVEGFTAQVLDGRGAVVPLEDSLANVRTIVALYESAQDGLPVRVG